jgi:hypothetical protein
MGCARRAEKHANGQPRIGQITSVSMRHSKNGEYKDLAAAHWILTVRFTNYYSITCGSIRHSKIGITKDLVTVDWRLTVRLTNYYSITFRSMRHSKTGITKTCLQQTGD